MRPPSGTTASRALDPQLHTHFVVANATWDSDRKRWLALDTCEMFKAIRYAGKVYQNALAHECRSAGLPALRLLATKKVSSRGSRSRGSQSDIRDRFSKRRAEVEAGIESVSKRERPRSHDP